MSDRTCTFPALQHCFTCPSCMSIWSVVLLARLMKKDDAHSPSSLSQESNLAPCPEALSLLLRVPYGHTGLARLPIGSDIGFPMHFRFKAKLQL